MLLSILVSVILPIFILVGVGVLLDRVFTLDLQTLARLSFNAFVPALLFIKILDAEISGPEMLRVSLFFLVHIGLLFALLLPFLRIPGLRQKKAVIALSVIFANAGNYGIPLVLLAYGTSLIGVLAVIILAQNLIIFSFGIWLMERHNRHAASIFLGLLRIPIVHAIWIALVLRGLQINMPEALRVPMTYLSDGMIPIALLSLGIQISRTRIAAHIPQLGAVALFRLILAPVLAAALVIPFGFTGVLASMLIVTSGLPVAVNVFIMAAEYRRDEAFASQSVFWTTILSAGTITLLLILTNTF